MRKSIVLFFIFLMIIIFANIAYADTNTKAEVNVTAVRLRENASTDSNVVTVVYEEDEVEVLGEEGEWYKVKSGSNTGYAKKEFFTITKQGDNLNTTSAEENVTEEPATQQEATETATETVPEASTEVETEQPEQNTNTETTEPQINGIYTLNSTASVKIVPNIWAKNYKEIAQGTTVLVESQLGNWYKITVQEISGWITKQKLTESINEIAAAPEQPAEPVEETAPAPEQAEPVEETPEQQETTKTTPKSAIVIVETARVRQSASTSAELVGTLDEDQVVTILDEEGDFYKISGPGISEGYISKSLVRAQGTTSRSSESREEDTISPEANAGVSELLAVATASSSTAGEEVVNFAKQYLGYPYVSGCSSPESGFDCSGFTKYVFGHFGYSLGSSAASQVSSGIEVGREDLQPGDLLLFYDNGKTKVGHCGIYIGNGEFIHSANPQRGVVTDNLNTSSYYNSRFVMARRIVGG